METDDVSGNKQGYECPKCKNLYSTAYSMYRHMRKVHNCDVNRYVTLYCPIENCDQSYDRYNALDTHLTHVHYADIRKETFNFSSLSDFETWLKDISCSSKTKYIKRSCNNSYRYYRCHRSGLPKTSTDKIGSMKSSVKIGRHCPSRIIAKITDNSVQVEFVPTHIGHEPEVAKIPLSEKKRMDMASRLSASAMCSTSGPASMHNGASCRGAGVASRRGATNVAAMCGTNSDDNCASIIIGDSSAMDKQIASQVVGQRKQSHGSSGGGGNNNNNNNVEDSEMALIESSYSPSRHELLNRFEQLLCAIRSDKHANIVRAQLEVCFALLLD